jgi:hypothetical protein
VRVSSLGASIIHKKKWESKEVRLRECWSTQLPREIGSFKARFVFVVLASWLETCWVQVSSLGASIIHKKKWESKEVRLRECSSTQLPREIGSFKARFVFVVLASWLETCWVQVSSLGASIERLLEHAFALKC